MGATNVCRAHVNRSSDAGSRLASGRDTRRRAVAKLVLLAAAARARVVASDLLLLPPLRAVRRFDGLVRRQVARLCRLDRSLDVGEVDLVDSVVLNVRQ